MAPLPQQALQPTIAAVYAAWEANATTGNRPHLGASIIGRECARDLWLTFRWAIAPKHSGRLLRLFDRGQREEAMFVAELRAAGITVHDTNPDTGEQFRFSAIGGHFGGSMDACALGILEAPATWHVVEMKTSSGKLFAKLAKEGVEQAKPEHAAQMQLYMHWSGMTRAFYIAVNKDNDELYSERLHYDEVAALKLLEKAKRIITATEPPPKISERPDWYQCRFCNHYALCHEQALPEANCRTCAHSTPELDGDQRWSCARYGCDLPVEVQRKGGECPWHVFLPSLVPWQAVDASADEGWIEYLKEDGSVVRNGPSGTPSRALQ